MTFGLPLRNRTTCLPVRDQRTSRDAPSSSTEIASIVHAKAVRKQADLWLNPPVYKFGILAVDKFDKIVDVGYEYAREQLSEWNGPSGSMATSSKTTDSTLDDSPAAG